MDTSKLKLIGKWIDLALYYVAPDGTVWACYATGRGYVNCGQEVEFRAQFSERYRGELIA